MHTSATAWASPDGDLSFDRRDNAADMPKCRVVETAYSWEREQALRTPWHDTIIYELHVRGFTMRHPEVAEHLRGTFAGLASPSVVRLPELAGHHGGRAAAGPRPSDERPLVRTGARNYWGYNTLGFFAPEPRYMAGDTLTEFKAPGRSSFTTPESR